MLRRPDLSVLQKPSILLIVFCTIFSIWTMDVWRQWRYNNPDDYPFRWDVAGYYSYLPAYVQNHGSFDFKNELRWYCTFSPQGTLMSKGTYGMALMYSPFYALAYKISANTNSPLDSLSYYFGTCIHWGSIFYGLLGLLILRNLLVKFFSEKVTAITIGIIFFGTNYLLYTLSTGEMPHAYLFLLISSFMLATYHWYKKPGFLRSLLLGFLIGLISLIRPTEFLIGLFFVFWMVEGGWNGVKERIVFLLKKWPHLLLMALTAFIIWIPQFLVWKDKTEHYLFFSYPGEQFFWGDPQIINILFSYRKGWFVYTPLMLLAFTGFFFMNNRTKPMRYLFLSMILLNIYMLSCWWDWSFGGGFGARCFIQHYSFLSFPLACFVAFIFEDLRPMVLKPLIQLVAVCVILSGVFLNLTQSYQYVQSMIHFDSMTKKAYWLGFGKYKFLDRDNGKFWGSLKAPEYDKMRVGEKRDK